MQGKKTGGRKPGTPNKRTLFLREAIEEANKLEKQGKLDGLTRVLQSMIRKANGVLVTETRDGEERVYRQAPDPAAANVILGYAFGRPKETMAFEVAPPEDGSANPDEGVVFAVPTFLVKAKITPKEEK